MKRINKRTEKPTPRSFAIDKGLTPPPPPLPPLDTTAVGRMKVGDSILIDFASNPKPNAAYSSIYNFALKKGWTVRRITEKRDGQKTGIRVWRIK